jgi:hypothetical protein
MIETVSLGTSRGWRTMMSGTVRYLVTNNMKREMGYSVPSESPGACHCSKGSVDRVPYVRATKAVREKTVASLIFELDMKNGTSDPG